MSLPRRHSIAPALALASALLLAACASGPDYVRPQVDMPAAWTPEAPWRAMQPQDAAPRGPWWERFNDAQLNALQQQALAGNQTLAIATARLAQARAQLDVAGAAQAPASRARPEPSAPVARRRSTQCSCCSSARAHAVV